MTKRPQPHDDDLATTLGHFNGQFRHRYHLPALTTEWLAELDGLKEIWDEIPAARANGVIDASCASLGRVALSITDRYAIGFLDAAGQAHVLAPTMGDDTAYRNHHVLMVNPLGGNDNWAVVARWIQLIGGEKARRTILAGLASEERPDYEAVDRMLRSTPHPRAVVLPPDEAFSADLAAEVSFIYGVSVETLRAWKLKHRRELRSGKPGRPKNR